MKQIATILIAALWLWIIVSMADVIAGQGNPTYEPSETNFFVAMSTWEE